MATGNLTPIWHPTFGNGAPGANTPRVQLYFDNSTSPYTGYVFHAGAWNKFGAFPNANCTQIQGVNVTVTPPSDTNKMTYNAGVPDWEGA